MCFFKQTLANEIRHEQQLLKRQRKLAPRITIDYLKARHARNSNRTYYLQERKRKRLEVAALKKIAEKPRETFVRFGDPIEEEDYDNIFV